MIANEVIDHVVQPDRENVVLDLLAVAVRHIMC
jgi:hypothetical protein